MVGAALMGPLGAVRSLPSRLPLFVLPAVLGGAVGSQLGIFTSMNRPFSKFLAHYCFSQASNSHAHDLHPTVKGAADFEGVRVAAYPASTRTQESLSLIRNEMSCNEYYERGIRFLVTHERVHPFKDRKLGLCAKRPPDSMGHLHDYRGFPFGAPLYKGTYGLNTP